VRCGPADLCQPEPRKLLVGDARVVIVAGGDCLEALLLCELKSLPRAHRVQLNVEAVSLGQRQHPPDRMGAGEYYDAVRDIKKIGVAQARSVIEILFAAARRHEAIDFFETLVVPGQKAHRVGWLPRPIGGVLDDRDLDTQDRLLARSLASLAEGNMTPSA
jgi:hypothetical protein